MISFHVSSMTYGVMPHLKSGVVLPYVKVSAHTEQRSQSNPGSLKVNDKGLTKV